MPTLMPLSTIFSNSCKTVRTASPFSSHTSVVSFVETS